LPRKRQKLATGISQSLCLPTLQLRQYRVIGDEQAADSCSPAYASFASTPSNTVRSQSIDLSRSTNDSQKSFTVDHIDYEQSDQPVLSAQGSNGSHITQAKTNQRDQDLPTWMELRQSHQQNTQALLSLIYAVGALPKLMLGRALSPQKRWNENGVEYQINPRDAHLEPHLKVLFLDSDGLWQALQHLVSNAAVGVERFNDMKEVYFCRSTLAEHVNSQERTYWVQQALWLFCYVFPRNQTTLSVCQPTTEEYTHQVRSFPERERLWAVLEILLRLCAEVDLQIPPNEEVIETLLALTKIGPLPRRRRILSVVDPLPKVTANADLLAEGVCQEVYFCVSKEISPAQANSSRNS
jgi:hypothetical protein